MLSATCAASSRVGVSTKTRICFLPILGCVCESLSSSGKVNPAVLPVPVCAAAKTSLPSITVGIACDCMGVGVS